MFFRTRLQWISALHLAITQSGCRDSYQRMLAGRRRAQREISSQRESEENMRKTRQILDIELTKAQLEEERMVSERISKGKSLFPDNR